MSRSEVSRTLDAMLRQHGFERNGTSWIRSRNLFSDVIEIQRGRARDGVTVNVAVMHAPTYVMAWGKLPPSAPSEVDCIIRTRLGLLVDGRDHWWPPNEQSAATEIADAVTSVALPFMSGFEDLASIEKWLEASKANRYPPEALYLAAVKHECGRHRDALEVLEQLLQRTRSGQWRERISSLAATLA